MKKKKNKTKSSSKQINGSDSSTFHVSIASTAVAQICHSVGYKATQTTALQTLTNITVRYLTSLATSAANSAVSTGRTECNLYDVIRGLEDVHADVGFKGNSAVTKRLSSLKDSEMLKDMMRFVHWSREIPFAKPLHTVKNDCGEKDVFTAVNEGKSEGEEKKKEVVPRGKQMVTSLCENEKLIDCVGKKDCEKEVFTVVNEGEKEKKVTRGKQMVTSLYGESNVAKTSYCGENEVLTAVNEGEKEKKVPRGRHMVTSLYGEMSHVPKWLPEFPRKSDCGEKMVFTEVNEGKSESEKEKVNYYKEVSELPVVRKKVRFEIGGKSGRGKDVNNLKFGVDLRSGVCKGGKRILCQIYEDDNDGKKYKKKIRKGDIDVVKKSMVKMKSARRYIGD